MNLLDPNQAEDAVREASKLKVPLVRYLVESLNLDGHDVAENASVEFGVPLFDITSIDRQSIPEKIVPPMLMAKHHAIPLFVRGNRLFIGVSDPTNLAALDEIKFATGISTDPILIEEKSLTKLLGELLEETDSLGSSVEGLDEDEDYDLQITGEGATETRKMTPALLTILPS